MRLRGAPGQPRVEGEALVFRDEVMAQIAILNEWRADSHVALAGSLAGDAAPPADPARQPVITYGTGSPVKIRMNGDFYRSYGYPFFDPTRGGTLKGTVEALSQLIDLADAGTE